MEASFNARHSLAALGSVSNGGVLGSWVSYRVSRNLHMYQIQNQPPASQISREGNEN